MPLMATSLQVRLAEVFGRTGGVRHRVADASWPNDSVRRESSEWVKSLGLKAPARRNLLAPAAAAAAAISRSSLPLVEAVASP